MSKNLRVWDAIEDTPAEAENLKLLSALKELHEASKVMTSGHVPSGDDVERYYKALTWSERVIKSAERE